jgi:hypothetical protein
MPYYFSDLKKYGDKQLKFQQTKSIKALRQDVNEHVINRPTISQDDLKGIEGGVCGALVADWLSEKLHQERKGMFKPGAEPDLHTNRNKHSVHAAVDSHIRYKREGGTNTQLLDRAGLQSDGTYVYVNDDWSMPRSLVEIAKPDNLKQGRGVYIGLSLYHRVKEGGGHAIGLYRSRGNKLWFFDPNCGVYTVKTKEFFDVWTAGYAKLDYEARFQHPRRITYVELKSAA